MARTIGIDHAGRLAALLGKLSTSFVYALAGLAIISSPQDAFVTAFRKELEFGALTAFVVAATPFSFLGITSAFWAFIAGFLASFLGGIKSYLSKGLNN